jgi:ankyrin repeat protein
MATILSRSRNSANENELHQALLSAIEKDELPKVEKLFYSLGTPIGQGTRGDTALIWAAKFGASRCVAFFLGEGADVNIRGELGMTALIWAAYYNRLDCVRLLLLDNKANVNTKNEAGDTALMWAAKRGAIDCVGLLLDNGADVNIRGANLNTENEPGDTVLTMAAFHGYTAIAKTLVEHGSHLLYVKDEFGDTSIDIAVGEHRWNTAIELLRWEKKAANEPLPSPNDCLTATNKYILQVKLFEQPKFARIPEQFQPAVFDYLLTAEPRQLELIKKINEQDDRLIKILLDMQLYLIGKNEAARLNSIIDSKYNFIALLLKIVATAPDPLTALFNKIINLEKNKDHIKVYCRNPYKPWRISNVKKFVGQLKKLYQDTKNQDRSFDDSIELATVWRHHSAGEYQPLLQCDSNTEHNSY